MKSIRFAFLALLALICLPGYSQRVVQVHSIAQYLVDEKSDITFSQARIKALENARIEALKTEFGSMVASDIESVTIVSPDGESRTELREITQEISRGEWLGDTANPVMSVSFDNDHRTFIYTVEVWGKARKVERSKLSLSWKVLSRGGGSETLKFQSGDRFFVSFKSPVSGYLAIYLLTDKGTAHCLLPYKSSRQGIYTVESDRQYIFFDRQSDPGAISYSLSTKQVSENNVLYMIFSPNPFTKCLESIVDASHPNALTVSEFEKWRIDNMQRDKDMVAERKWVKIENNNKQ